jgi:mRNA interferase MazF
VRCDPERSLQPIQDCDHGDLITSKLARSGAPGNVSLRKGDANLPKASMVNVSQVLTVDKDDLVERIGRLPAGTVDAIRSGLELLFERVPDRLRAADAAPREKKGHRAKGN